MTAVQFALLIKLERERTGSKLMSSAKKGTVSGAACRFGCRSPNRRCTAKAWSQGPNVNSKMKIRI